MQHTNYKKAGRAATQSGFSVDCSGLEKVIKLYLAAQGCSDPTIQRDNGNNFPVVFYRAPNCATLRTFVIKPNEAEEQVLKKLAGNIGVKFTPKWQQQSVAGYVS